MDWTNLFNQKKIHDFANQVLHELLNELFENKLLENYRIKLNKNELVSLYRWSVFISVNTFTDRLLKVLSNLVIGSGSLIS